MTKAAACVDERETIALLQRLLRINTENPPGNEEPAARLLEEYLAALGFETELHEAVPAPRSRAAGGR